MAIRSGIHGSPGGHAAVRREPERDAEDGALSGSGAVRDDVAAHAPRELARDGETETRAMRHAITAAAVVRVEQPFGDVGREAAAAITDVEPPAAVDDAGRDLHAA